MNYDAIIFDIDGTLWNACAVSAKGMNRALQDLKIQKVLTTKDIESVSGKPSDQIIPVLFGTLTRQHPEMLKRVDEGEKRAIEENGGSLFDGVLEGFQKLSKTSRLFLVSNCQNWYLESFIKFSDLSDSITGVDCYGLSGVTKAEMLKKITEKNQAKNAVYVGDTEGDQIAAERAGIDFIGAGYGFGNIQSAKQSFGSFPEIVEHLLA